LRFRLIAAARGNLSLGSVASARGRSWLLPPSLGPTSQQFRGACRQGQVAITPFKDHPTATGRGRRSRTRPLLAGRPPGIAAVQPDRRANRGGLSSDRRERRDGVARHRRKWHDHLFYLQRPNIDPSGHFDNPIIVPQNEPSARPRLYLAKWGDDDAQPTGSVEPYTDLSLESVRSTREKLVGPHLDVTGPYSRRPGRRSFIPEPPDYVGRGRPEKNGRLLGPNKGVEFIQGLYEYHARRAQSRESTRRTATISRSPAICARSLTPEAAEARDRQSGSTASSSTRQLDPGQSKPDKCFRRKRAAPHALLAMKAG